VRPPEHILIETSGLTLPKPLVRAFAWPEIRAHTTVDAVLTVIDGAAVAAGRFAADPEAVTPQRAANLALTHDNPLEEVFTDQLTCADLVVLNTTDLIVSADCSRSAARSKGGVAPGSSWSPRKRAGYRLTWRLGLVSVPRTASAPEPHYRTSNPHTITTTSKLCRDVRRRQVVQAAGSRLQYHLDRPWRAGRSARDASSRSARRASTAQLSARRSDRQAAECICLRLSRE
jgi:cobalamin biosynthesis protein CobW